MRRFLLLTLALLLTACAAQTANRGPQTAAPTATPTVYRPPSTVYPPPSTVTPSPEPITLQKTFGLTGDALKAFAGAEQYITRAKDGSYLVTAQVRNPETGKLEQIQLTLDPASFNTHPEITNSLGLYTVDGYLPKQDYLKLISTPTPAPTAESTSTPDTLASTPTPEKTPTTENIKATLIWLPETHEFRLAYDLKPIVNPSTIGTETPQIIQENLASIPEIPMEDIQNGLAARSVLLAMERDGYKPFSDGVIERYKNTPPGSKGSSLYFEQQPDGSKVVWLKHRADDKLPITLNDSATKITPYFFRTRIGEQTYDIAALAWFDPKDPENPKPEEFKVIFAAPFSIGGGRNYTLEDFTTTNAFSSKKPLLIKWAGIYGENLNPQNPEFALLAQLLQIKGNDPGDLIFPGYGNKLRDDFKNEFAQLSSEKGKDVREILIMWNGEFQPLDPNHQRMLFLFEVGVAR